MLKPQKRQCKQAPDKSRNERPTYQLPVKVPGRRRSSSRHGLRRRAVDGSGLHWCDALEGGVEGAGGGRDDAAEAEVLDGDAVDAAVEEQLRVAAGCDSAEARGGRGWMARHVGWVRARARLGASASEWDCETERRDGGRRSGGFWRQKLESFGAKIVVGEDGGLCKLWPELGALGEMWVPCR